jgi:hypothetical protein
MGKPREWGPGGAGQQGIQGEWQVAVFEQKLRLSVAQGMLEKLKRMDKAWLSSRMNPRGSSGRKYVRHARLAR